MASHAPEGHSKAISEVNGVNHESPLHRADEVEDLIDAVKALVVPFIRAADEAAPIRARGAEPVKNVLAEMYPPEELIKRLALSLPQGEGRGRDGLLETVESILQYSVNTWDQGFLDKLYSNTNAVGVISELVLAVLNTNVHVYSVSPALTLVEKTTARHLAALFGLTGPRAGGIACQGGSGANLTSLVIARNTLYPETKREGNGAHRFAIFTSAHGHYSVEKAAGALGMGSAAVVPVAVDARTGRMDAAALRARVLEARADGRTPLYVNATAGTTVLGSYDPFTEVAAVCREFGLWMHVDGSWGGSAAFSAAQRAKLAGAELADSITVNPHKMMHAPLPCSFLLTNDLAVFHRANTLPAGYLFHGSGEEDAAAGEKGGEAEEPDRFWDIADLTLQCGRRGDALKLALSWIFYGLTGFEAAVNRAFAAAARLATLVDAHPDLALASESPPPCLQVCFYYAPGGRLADSDAENTRRTAQIVHRLVRRGFMIDYAPGSHGSFFRVVVNSDTLDGTLDGLVKAIEEVGREVVPL